MQQILNIPLLVLSLSSTSSIGSMLLVYKPIRGSLHAKHSDCFVLYMWIIPCNKSSHTPSLSVCDVNKTGICTLHTHIVCLELAMS